MDRGKRLEVALDRRLVAARDRPGQSLAAALRPVGGRSQDERGEQLARVLDAGPLEQLGGRLLERDEEVGGDRGGGMVGGAGLLGDLERAHAEPLGQPGREGERGRGRARDGTWSAGQVGVSPSGIVCSGWSAKVATPRSAAAASAERPVAPLVWPMWRGEGAAATTASQASSIAPSGTQRRTARSPAAAAAADSSRPASRGRDPGVGGSRRKRAPDPSRADDRRAHRARLRFRFIPVPVLASEIPDGAESAHRWWPSLGRSAPWSVAATPDYTFMPSRVTRFRWPYDWSSDADLRIRMQRCLARFEELVAGGTERVSCPQCGAEDPRRCSRGLPRPPGSTAAQVDRDPPRGGAASARRPVASGSPRPAGSGRKASFRERRGRAAGAAASRSSTRPPDARAARSRRPARGSSSAPATPTRT